MKKLAIVALVLVALSFVGCGTPAKDLLNTSWEVRWGGDGSYSVLTFADLDVVTYTDVNVSKPLESGSYAGTWEAVGTTVKIEMGLKSLNGTWKVLIEENDDGVEVLTLTDVEDESRTHTFTKLLDLN